MYVKEEHVDKVIHSHLQLLRKDIKRDSGRTIRSIKSVSGKVDQISESVSEHKKAIRNLQDGVLTRERDCPYGPMIKRHETHLLTEKAVGDLLKKQEKDRADKERILHMKLRWVVGVVSVFFTIVTITVNVTLYYLSKNDENEDAKDAENQEESYHDRPVLDVRGGTVWPAGFYGREPP